MSTPDAARVAVVGFAGRFPGAADAAELWAALAAGRELLIPAATGDAGHGPIAGADRFDAGFFGYAPAEALLVDPQQRVFLECAWEALEHAGCDPVRFPGPIGVYAGSGDTDHVQTLRSHRDRLPDVSETQFRLASSPDFLTSRVAYKLGLTGPAVSVQTACSTSLVAVHLAVQGLLAGDCDLALAGGATVHVPFPREPAEAGITSTDGHCRAFDAGATGAVVSDGAGVVVLRRLEDALEAGDHVYAVVLGSAVNNDGSGKVGFAAPSVTGQAAAVRAAHLVADVEPASIDHVEAHGTGTPVGDPIEVRALSSAFGPDAGPVVLGTVKATIGHTDTAAGVLGLVKVLLALEHELLPPHPTFRTPNPEAELPASPFTVNTDPLPWPRTDRPRRAGINSLGLGGTNAHVVLEEAPVPVPGPPAPPHQLLPLSARTPAALAAAAGRLGAALDGRPLADVAWTLQTGRQEFPERGFVVATGPADARAALADPARLSTGRATTAGREVVFLFPGQGGQHVGMAAELYRDDPGFRADVDECAELARPELGLDLCTVLHPAGDPAPARELLATMRVGQPAVFAVEYALARLWIRWGVRPAAVLGHSLGAYAAATVAGVLALPDAVALVLERGRLLGEVPDGAMLAVPLPVAELAPLLDADLSVAAVNGPGQCVVAGPAAAVAALRSRLAGTGVDGRVLHISTAAHSHLVEPALAAYGARVAAVDLRPPVLPWISDRTGAPVTAAEARDPAYWTGHLRHPVDFSAALATVLARPDTALLEVGPGRTLTALARQHPDCAADRPVVACMPHPADPTPAPVVLLTAVGALWRSGVPVDWAALHPPGRRKVPLPTYPFQRRRFRLDLPDEVDDEPAGPVAGSVGSPTERAVATAFGAVLGLREVDPHASFFELGGDSMLALRVAGALRRELGVELGVRAVFRSPSVAALAAVLDGGRP